MVAAQLILEFNVSVAGFYITQTRLVSDLTGALTLRAQLLPLNWDRRRLACLLRGHEPCGRRDACGPSIEERLRSQSAATFQPGRFRIFEGRRL